MNAVWRRGGAPSGPGRATHARAYQRRYPLLWWTANRRYTLYMFRELSAVTLALWLLLMLRQLDQLRQGPEAYARFLRRLRSPWWVVFNVFNLGVALLHSYTWLSLTARVLPLPGALQRWRRQPFATALLAGWAGLSCLIALPFLFGGRRRK